MQRDRTIEEVKEEIKHRTDLAAIIGEYVTLKKAGTSFKGLCPFHGEKTPSFHVKPLAGFFHCFGCGKSGDAITFVQEQVGYSFMEALRYLGERCGIDVPEASSSDNPEARQQRRQARDRYYAVNRRATEFFQSKLSGQALDYLTASRGLTPETIERYQVGFAPDSWDVLTQLFQRNGSEAVRDAEAVGLISKGKSGFYARFRNRVMFPVHNRTGEVVAFSGRDLSNKPDAAKYYNSSDSTLFTKGKVLFGLFQARRAIRDKDRIIVVEGNVDVLSLSQSGFAETVAPLGTALSSDQCNLLKRMSHNVILMYDGDDAGRAATMKAIPLLLEAGLSGKVVVLPVGQDPDTLVHDQGPEAMEALITKAVPLFDHIILNAMSDFDGTIPAASAVVDKVRPLFGMLPNRIEQELYATKLAQRLQVQEIQLKRWLRSGTKTNEAIGGLDDAQTSHTPQLERQLLGLVLHHPEYLPHWLASGANEPQVTTHEGVRAVLMRAHEIQNDTGRVDSSELMDWLASQGLQNAKNAVATLLLEEDPYGEESERAFVEIIDSLKERADRRDKDAARAKLRMMSAHEQLDQLKNLGQTP